MDTVIFEQILELPPKIGFRDLYEDSQKRLWVFSSSNLYLVDENNKFDVISAT